MGGSDLISSSDTARYRALQAFAEGHSDDPFGVMGPGKLAPGILTAYVPGAARLDLLQEGKRHPLDPVKGLPSVFAGKLPGPGAYLLCAEDGHGTTWEIDDPYRFGPVLGEMDEYLLGEGTHMRLWQALGAHVMTHEGSEGTHFAVWAPNARRVSVVGDFNHWDGRRHQMRRRGATGVWEIFLPGVEEGAAYKYEILGPAGEALPLKADPVGFGSEHPPSNASVVRDIRGYGWHDAGWMETRAGRNDAKRADLDLRGASRLVAAAHERGRAAAQLSRKPQRNWSTMSPIWGSPISNCCRSPNFPFDGSWGYQPVGLFAPTIRFGPPHEFRDLVDAAHRKRAGRDPRLGAGAFSDRCPWAGPVRRHSALRTCRSARRASIRTGTP